MENMIHDAALRQGLGYPCHCHDRLSLLAKTRLEGQRKAMIVADPEFSRADDENSDLVLFSRHRYSQLLG